LLRKQQIILGNYFFAAPGTLIVIGVRISLIIQMLLVWLGLWFSFVCILQYIPGIPSNGHSPLLLGCYG